MIKLIYKRLRTEPSVDRSLCQLVCFRCFRESRRWRRHDGRGRGLFSTCLRAWRTNAALDSSFSRGCSSIPAHLVSSPAQQDEINKATVERNCRKRPCLG